MSKAFLDTLGFSDSEAIFIVLSFFVEQSKKKLKIDSKTNLVESRIHVKIGSSIFFISLFGARVNWLTIYRVRQTQFGSMLSRPECSSLYLAYFIWYNSFEYEEIWKGFMSLISIFFFFISRVLILF